MHACRSVGRYVNSCMDNAGTGSNRQIIGKGITLNDDLYPEINLYQGIDLDEHL